MPEARRRVQHFGLSTVVSPVVLPPLVQPGQARLTALVAFLQGAGRSGDWVLCVGGPDDELRGVIGRELDREEKEHSLAAVLAEALRLAPIRAEKVLVVDLAPEEPEGRALARAISGVIGAEGRVSYWPAGR